MPGGEVDLKEFAIFGLLLFLWVPSAIAPVNSKAETSPASPVRTYYIAADEIMWNYLPRGSNLTGTPGSEVEGGAAKGIFLKAIYREYMDARFQTLKPRPPEWEHLGLLGPVIRAAVGDTVKVIFKNNTKIFCSVHPHGLAYEKESEGALYNDGSSALAKRGDAVPPGQTYTYTWTVPERAGPADGDPSSIDRKSVV